MAELKYMNYDEVESYLKTNKTIIIPLGSIEQHGPGLPLGTDTLIAEFISKTVSEETGIVLGPTLSPGVSLVPHMNFKGTISFMSSTYQLMVKEYVKSLYVHGFRNFMLINGHGGNDSSIKNAMTELCYELDNIKYGSANWWRIPEIGEKMKELLGHSIGHACASEAGLILLINKDLVKKEKLLKEFPKKHFTMSNNLTSKYLTKSGVIGADQTKADIKMGKLVLDMSVKKYKEMINNMINC